VEKMAKTVKDSFINIQSNKTGKIERLAISLIKKFLNYFWEIVDILSYKNEKAAEFYAKSIGENYKTEYESCGISKKDRVLHIGCGAYPLSEIALAKLFNAQVVGIDKNPKVVKLADRVISKMKLDKIIKVEHGNGTNYPVDKFDVIIVSSCSLPKAKILENVFKIAKKPSTIIVRELDIATNGILDYVNSYEDIVLEKKIHHQSLLLPIGWNAFCFSKK
jgi:precorrin-6B methylase 2